MFLGYVKKALISDNIAPIIDHNISNYFLLDSYQMLFALILFSIQIYFDFSGYSDIARGLAFLFGIKLKINFKQPYFSTSPSDFWQRWHISLSTWLRDYLYIPLGGNRKGYIRTNINLMVTMLLGGLWHGASWNFVFWGGLHGIYLIIYKLFRIKISTNNKFPFYYKLLKIFLMYLLILITWLPFRTEDIHTTLIIINKFLFWSGNVNIANLILIIFLFVLLVIIDLPLYYFGTELSLLKLPKWLLWAVMVIGIFGITLTIIINQGSVRPFIYFQF